MKKIIHILFAPFRAIKNRLLDSIIKRANITNKTISNTLVNDLPNFQYDLVQEVAEKIDMDDIIGGLDYSALGYEVDECELASHLHTSDIAYEITNNHLSTSEVADEIDLDRLASIVKKEAGTDLEAINSRLDEIDAKQVDDSKYNDLVKTIKDLEAFTHAMQDEHKENYVRHTNRFHHQDDDLNRIETEMEENLIRLNKDMHQAHLERNKLYEKTENFVSRQWILDAIEARAIGIDEELSELKSSTISNILYQPKLKGYRVTFMDDFEAINEEEAYEKLIHYCEEVCKNQDVTAFNFEEIK
jgi:hypothetical protein